MDLKNIAIKAKNASLVMSSLSTKIKNDALAAVASAIEDNKKLILEENKKDLDIAQKLVDEYKLTKAMYSRLELTDYKIRDMVQGIKDIIKLDDPINKVLWGIELDNNLELYRISSPIGVIGVIFESRPDVVAQIASLAIKSSNAIILKGGSEASFSNKILVQIINTALSTVKEFPENAISMIQTREDVNKMLEMDEYIDLIIPRGGNSLVKFIQSNTKIPVLGHADGICHVYADENADFEKAIKICIDSKTQYPSACNAVETILVNKKIANEFLPVLISALKEADVLVKGDEMTCFIVPGIEKTTEDDWSTEYGDKIVSIKVVNDLSEAINHINTYGSGHTDCIVTENKEHAEIFMNMVDSAGVYLNASTRFADGFRYGLGAEVGISTNKTHARGPVGLEGLVIYKYKLYGNGQVVAEYSGENAKNFTHKTINN
ncbi:MAG: glutamate-5-semialdehyde dehydrogenase [Candidatus Gastranaerophilaceae bacterium]|jgi:glutamate-5-semialdehyde dehydrogenase